MQVSYSKFIGGTLLIVGTSIGGGMLALPLATASVGFWNSVIFLTLCWLIMTSGALLILEVNQQLPPGSNMISMAKATLGLPGKIAAWIIYLFLLYTLISAYISGGSDVLTGLLSKMNIHPPESLPPLIYTFIFSLIVYSGIRSVDYANRALMFAKMGTYLLLILVISPHISPANLKNGEARTITNSIMILITSFGFATLVPSLSDYFHRDTKTLKKLIIFGSLIPLICYILWNCVIMGTIHNTGENGLISLSKAEYPITGLTLALKNTISSPLISIFFNFFTSICMLTAFLTVSLGLFDFLADGLQYQKKGIQGFSTLGLTFLPPLGIVLINPGIYLSALNYAGFCCVLLLLLLPALMAWRSRVLFKEGKSTALIPGGNFSLIVIVAVSLFLLIIAI